MPYLLTARKQIGKDEKMSEDPRTEELVREMLVRIADNWTLLMIGVLAKAR